MQASLVHNASPVQEKLEMPALEMAYAWMVLMAQESVNAMRVLMEQHVRPVMKANMAATVTKVLTASKLHGHLPESCKFCKRKVNQPKVSDIGLRFSG